MCWIKDSGVQYGSVVAYLIVVLLFNSTIFAIVITTMLKLRSVTSPQGKRQSRNIICSVLGLTCILGLTWVVGFFSMGYTNYVILLIFTILNSLQETAEGRAEFHDNWTELKHPHSLRWKRGLALFWKNKAVRVQEGAIADNTAKF
ncbi:adhesion G-protein coupled receptor G2-like [Oncorhynchus masou masou]|uniref:adhesion G-protein coupled receptor G2-like n=1 Tax=Oncorhynchus masou masou TaxID=90313 RepID=UPI0031841380